MIVCAEPVRYTYYRCWPNNNNRGRRTRYAAHPRTVYVREEAIKAVIAQAFNEFLFTPTGGSC